MSSPSKGVLARSPVKGMRPKNICGIPWRVALALQADGWYLRQDIIWHKPNPMPESVTDRCTKAHEYIFLLTKQQRYFYDADAIAEPSTYSPGCGWDNAGHEIANKTKNVPNPAFRHISTTRNRRSVWTIPTSPYPDAHFATYPEKLVEPCIKAGSMEGSTVLDPFCGSGTTGVVACKHNRDFIGIELNPEYARLANKRIGQSLKPSTYCDQSSEFGPLFQ